MSSQREEINFFDVNHLGRGHVALYQSVLLYERGFCLFCQTSFVPHNNSLWRHVKLTSLGIDEECI